MDLIAVLRSLSVAALPIVIAITFHEVAHGWVAYKLGDPTAKSMGRLTLNPLPHIDLVGTVIFPIMLFILSNGSFIFGSAKPVPVDYRNLGKPRRDMALVAAAGPAANVAIAMASLLVLMILSRIFTGDLPQGSVQAMVLTPVAEMLRYSIFFNIFIAAFNLIPIPPLDGGRIAVSMLPYRHAYQYSKIEPYGIFIVLFLWMLGVVKYIIAPIQMVIFFIINLFQTFLGGIL